MKILSIILFILVLLINWACHYSESEKLKLWIENKSTSINDNYISTIKVFLENRSQDTLIIYCFKNYRGDFLVKNEDDCRYPLSGLHLAVYDVNNVLIEPDYHEESFEGLYNDSIIYIAPLTPKPNSNDLAPSNIYSEFNLDSLRQVAILDNKNNILQSKYILPPSDTLS